MQASLQSDPQYPVWHPFTPLQGGAPELEVARAEGCTLHLANGTTLIDAVSSWWVNLHGHARPEIADAIAQQARELEQVIFAGFTHKPAVSLAHELLSMANAEQGNYAKVFYSDDGSTAIEVALKMCLQYWHNLGQNRRQVVALEGAYHGDTFGAMSMADRTPFNAPFDGHMFQVQLLPLVPCQDVYAPLSDADTATIQQMEQACSSGQVAVFIYEPLVQGSAGMRFYKLALLEALLTIAQKYGVLCIADEVMTGFSRTGPLLATHHIQDSKLWPDLVCLSKGITGGFLPLGATLCTAAIQEAFRAPELTKTFFHGHSYTANPLACAAALASLDILNSKESRAARASLSTALAALCLEARDWKHTANARHLGHIMALEWSSASATDYFNEARHYLYQSFIKLGVLLRPLGNVVYVLPPYTLSEAEMKQVAAALRAVFDGEVRPI